MKQLVRGFHFSFMFPEYLVVIKLTAILGVLETEAPENSLKILEARLITTKFYSIQWKLHTWNACNCEHSRFLTGYLSPTFHQTYFYSSSAGRSITCWPPYKETEPVLFSKVLSSVKTGIKNDIITEEENYV